MHRDQTGISLSTDDYFLVKKNRNFGGSKLPKSVEWFFILSSGLVSLIIFLNATDSFSYDHIHYIRYFNELKNVGLRDLLTSTLELLPYPYIFIPPGGLFEFGFGFTAWALMLVFQDALVAYAVIGAISISIRVWVLRSIGVTWLWVIVLNIYAITLFEANAIRLGCAFTLLLLGLRFILLGKKMVLTFFFFLAAILFHLQTILFVILFSLVFYGYKLFASSQGRLAVLIFLMSLIIFLVFNILSDLGISKLEDYVEKNSAATGVTSISVLGLLVMVFAIGKFFVAKKRNYYALTVELRTKVWLATIVAAVPALLLLFLATSAGALGDRLWQLSFAMISSLIFSNYGRNKNNRWAGVSLIFLMGVSVVNVIYRYPLSNFFYPLFPYSEINPEFLLII